MRKTRNPISHSIMHQSIMWKLGSFISLLLIFVSTSLFASENPSLENFVYADSDVEMAQTDQSENQTIHITEGTVIIGLENMSQNTEIKHLVEEKTTQKASVKKIRSITSKKAAQEIKAQQKVKDFDTTARIDSRQSQNSFTSSNRQLGVGTLTFNQSFKALTVHQHYIIVLVLPGDVTVADKYAFSFTPNTMYSHSFTRPPPFI